MIITYVNISRNSTIDEEVISRYFGHVSFRTFSHWPILKSGICLSRKQSNYERRKDVIQLSADRAGGGK